MKLINELKDLQERIAQIIKDNSVPDLFVRLIAVSKEIPNPENKPVLIGITPSISSGEGQTTYYEALEDLNVGRGITIPAGTAFSINGFVLQIIESKVLAVLEDRLEFTVEEPQVLDILLTLKPNNAIMVNGTKVLYTRMAEALDSRGHLFGSNHCYSLDSEVEFVTAIFKYDHIELMVNEGTVMELSPAMDLVVKCLDLTEKERNRIAREDNPRHYQMVDAFYADQKEKVAAAEAVLKRIEDEAKAAEQAKVNNTWYKRLINYFK